MSEAVAKRYRRLPYHRQVSRLTEDDGTYFVAFVREIPWIRAFGDTPVEALYELDQVFDDCIETILAAGDEIPEPVLWPANYGAPDAPPRAVARARGKHQAGTGGRVTYREASDVRPWDTPEVKGEELAHA
ncbi:MAG: type II toxin-antitoxin system HicB family antitoxin [Longimicrobiales bacterium]|nr:type II toxin-antitoxin system HicB family antitoxin [Longimicrobiales bacterium]